MANIENRRIKRRLVRVAAIAGGALVVCAVVLAVVLLPKACRGRGEEPGKSGTEPAATAPALTDSPTPAVSETVVSSETAVPSASAPQPTSTTAAQTPEASAEPHQTSDDRSLALFTVTVDPTYDAVGMQHLRFKGSCTIGFVNNTDVSLYSANIAMNGLNAVSATLNGSAVRFYPDDNGVCILPFGSALEPGETAELFIEFSGTADTDTGFTLPYIDYDTVMDAVCFVSSSLPLRFSVQGVSVEHATRFEYKLEAESIDRIAIALETFEN